MNKVQKIVLVEDEKDIADLIKEHLTQANYDFIHFFNGEDFIKKVEKDFLSVDLLILDLMLPGMDGIEICKAIRNNQNYKKIPIMMLTAKAEALDKVIGLEIGADDYMGKPFSPRELVARVKALLRRVRPQIENLSQERTNSENAINEKTLNLGNILKIYPKKYEVRLNNELVKFTLIEFKLLCVLVENKEMVLSRQQMLEASWESNEYVDERTVDVHIRHIRQKLQEYGELIQNIRGVGYKITEN